MSNMSYCRFRNTLADLIDCQDALNEHDGLDNLSEEEKRSAQRLIRVCRDIADDWGDLI